MAQGGKRSSPAAGSHMMDAHHMCRRPTRSTCGHRHAAPNRPPFSSLFLILSTCCFFLKISFFSPSQLRYVAAVTSEEQVEARKSEKYEEDEWKISPLRLACPFFFLQWSFLPKSSASVARNYFGQLSDAGCSSTCEFYFARSENSLPNIHDLLKGHFNWHYLPISSQTRSMSLLIIVETAIDVYVLAEQRNSPFHLDLWSSFILHLWLLVEILEIIPEKIVAMMMRKNKNIHQRKKLSLEKLVRKRLNKHWITWPSLEWYVESFEEQFAS